MLNRHDLTDFQRRYKRKEEELKRSNEEMLDALSSAGGKGTTVEVDGGKYKAVVKDDGSITVYRHGEWWRDCTGDNLIYWLIVELAEARK